MMVQGGAGGIPVIKQDGMPSIVHNTFRSTEWGEHKKLVPAIVAGDPDNHVLLGKYITDERREAVIAEFAEHFAEYGTGKVYRFPTV